MDKKCPNLYQRARLSTGMSQERAAELLGLSPESLKQYEGGKTVPKDETVAKMVEVYHLPWLALEHAQATDTLGVVPEFDSIVVELRETMAAIYQVIYSDAKRERPEAATSERSGEKVCGIGSTTVGCINYSTRSTTHASPNFRREGGVSL